MAYSEIANSTFLDLAGYRVTEATTVIDAYGFPPADVTVAPAAGFLGFNVALVLDRYTSETSLLAESWGMRQQTLAELNSSGELWDVYGADKVKYGEVTDHLTNTLGLTILDASNSNYVSSAESRTIWVEINSPSDFSSLFGTDLYLYLNPSDTSDFLYFWNGNLSLEESWDVEGLWVDTGIEVPPSNFVPGVEGALTQGWQSPGNGAVGNQPMLAPQDIANDLYNFPLANFDVETGLIGLIEPGIGSAVNGATTFDERLETYLSGIGVAGTGTVTTQGADGQTMESGGGGERSLDIAVAASINPNSDIRLYVGSGETDATGNAQASTFTAIQSAIWDTAYNPGVLSSSFGDYQSMSPDSPFYWAYRQLFIDAALRNQTVFDALGDGGSGNELGNGLTNLAYNETSPYVVMVGGTAISNLSSAKDDPTLTLSTNIVQQALAGDPATIWQLVSGGLTVLPADLSNLQVFLEAVWNQYYVSGTNITTLGYFEGGYTENTTTSGGVDPTQPTPSYQLAYGLNPVTADPSAESGRGAPDVAANAGGNTAYLVPDGNMEGTGPSGGTSAATPLWASLAVQINTIFNDQGLPNLGYMNDLLYIVSAVAPGAFNDVTIGNNMSSFTVGGAYTTGGESVNPTNFGYEAGEGYDYVSGLGTPNGVLLARALTTLAHSQMYFPDVPNVLDIGIGPNWISGATQSLLFQPTLTADETWSVSLGGSAVSFSGGPSGAYAWTNQFAQQSLQADFAADLVTMFDRYAHGQVYQAELAYNTSVEVTMGGTETDQPQALLTSPYGFVDFVSDGGDGSVQVARPVAIATTALGADDQDVVVRMRQNGMNDISVLFYEVDDLSGAIGGVDPGEAGYAAAVAGRAYQTGGGATWIAGEGYGQYSQTEIVGVDGGDLIAMSLTSGGHTYYAFAAANEQVDGQSVAHLWNYGLNTWGWEDLYGGGDQDFNDLVVQLDFTSTAGAEYLV
ncbi:DUF4114 domain-containing protein [Aquabacter spiritensis]|uniref:Peptidase S53 domain-containing protein n=1 Tax=Aquabacter spiritensis TaxID=933073 RepID=A0A4R3M3G7_9HYPH|nr:DUF4114 domain-containing protein [Aquabacter spiritensis]TCT05705.1 hypothetical protein EDC64_104265 [Aquabacter spiritensis]